MKEKNTKLNFPSPLMNAIKEEMRVCECEHHISCPASCYMENPPADMQITPEVVKIMTGDIQAAKKLMGKCSASKSRVSRIRGLADQLIFDLNVHNNQE